MDVLAFLKYLSDMKPHCVRLGERGIKTLSVAPPGILGPMKRNLIGPLYRPAKKFEAVLYKAIHFNYIFDYHSHICEKNNMTVTWLLLTVFLVVPHAGLIYLHNCRLTGGGSCQVQGPGTQMQTQVKVECKEIY